MTEKPDIERKPIRVGATNKEQNAAIALPPELHAGDGVKFHLERWSPTVSIHAFASVQVSMVAQFPVKAPTIWEGMPQPPYLWTEDGRLFKTMIWQPAWTRHGKEAVIKVDGHFSIFIPCDLNWKDS